MIIARQPIRCQPGAWCDCAMIPDTTTKHGKSRSPCSTSQARPSIWMARACAHPSPASSVTATTFAATLPTMRQRWSTTARVTAQTNRCRRHEPKAAWTKSQTQGWQSGAECAGHLAVHIAGPWSGPLFL